MGIYLANNTFNPFNTSKLTEEYLNICKKIWETTTKNNVPPIFTLKHLSLLTNIDYKILLTFTHRSVNPYKKIIIENAVKKRELLVPWKELSIVQNWIKKNILEKINSSNYATAYEKNCSIVKNAKVHMNSPWLIKLDLKNFFHTIYEHNVYEIFKKLGYPSLLSLELAKLCTFEKRINNESLIERFEFEDILAEEIKTYPYQKSTAYLPQGASTSPKLANLFARKLDKEIMQLLNSKFYEFQLKFTRYSDDIVISGNLGNYEKCKEVITEVSQIIQNNKLKINENKTKIFSPKTIKKITGINIVNGDLKPSKKIINYVKTSLYYIEKYSLEEHISNMKTDYSYDIETYKEHLLGKIFFIKYINKDLGQIFLDKYKQLNL
jgi:RNA-directed DNA polymerase